MSRVRSIIQGRLPSPERRSEAPPPLGAQPLIKLYPARR
jgi:hypothetical protein